MGDLVERQHNVDESSSQREAPGSSVQRHCLFQASVGTVRGPEAKEEAGPSTVFGKPAPLAGGNVFGSQLPSRADTVLMSEDEEDSLTRARQLGDGTRPHARPTPVSQSPGRPPSQPPTLQHTRVHALDELWPIPLTCAVVAMAAAAELYATAGTQAVCTRETAMQQRLPESRHPTSAGLRRYACARATLRALKRNSRILSTKIAVGQNSCMLIEVCSLRVHSLQIGMHCLVVTY